MPSIFWSSNLRFLRQRRKLSQDELAAALSVTRSKLTAHENGNTKNPPSEDLLQFSAYFKMGVDTLLKVDLSTLSEQQLVELEAGNDGYATGTKIRVLATTVDVGNRENIELVPLKARAGYASGYGDPEFVAKLPVFSMPQLPKDRKYRMFPITGDSMLPIPEDAQVIGEYVEDWKGLKAGTPCIVVTRSEGIVFKLVTVTGRVMQLVSLNTAYAPYEVALQDVLEVWRFKSYMTETFPEAVGSVEQMLAEMRGDIKALLQRGK